MDWWEEGFCDLLARGPRHVIRYDFRDAGQSTSYPPGAPGYSGLDLVADAVGLLDAVGVEAAHVAGVSMGGALAQRLALEHPDRVASLTLMSTSPIGPGVPELPPPSEALADPPPEPDWADRDAVIGYVIAGARAYAGSLAFDEERVRGVAARMVDRTRDVAACMTNHYIAESGEPVRRRLGDLRAPTLVVHGSEDPLFPLPHGEALARAIPGARLHVVAGMGHELPPPEAWDEVAEAILGHTAGR